MPTQAYYETRIDPRSQATLLKCRFWAIKTAALLLLAGCATEKPPKIIPTLVPMAQRQAPAQLRTLAFAVDPTLAQVSFDKGAGQINFAVDGAGDAAGNLLSKTTSDGLINAAISPVTFAFAPIAAGYGAIASKKHLKPAELSAREAVLQKSMQQMASQDHFQRWLLRASEKSLCRLIPTNEIAASRCDATLESRVEELRLQRVGAGDTSFALHIKIRARLVRPDGTILCDQPLEYRSGTSLFLDWTLQSAVQNVADTAYQVLADRLFSQLLAAEAPIEVGAAFRKSPGPSAAKLARADHISGSASSAQPSVQLVAARPSLIGDSVSIGVYSTLQSPSHVAFQIPLTRDEAHSEAMQDVNYIADGLGKHPNTVILLTASAIAIPISLWKQAAALVRGNSSKELYQAETSLRAAVIETPPAQAFAVQIAQQLAPKTSQRVVLVKNSPLQRTETDRLKVALASAPASMNLWKVTPNVAWLPVGQSAGSFLANQGTDTALEIHVEHAALMGNGGIDSKLYLDAHVQVTLLRLSDHHIIYSCHARYRGEARKISHWAERDARFFREELQRCYNDLSGALVDQLIEGGFIPPNRRPVPTLTQN